MHRVEDCHPVGSGAQKVLGRAVVDVACQLEVFGGYAPSCYVDQAGADSFPGSGGTDSRMALNMRSRSVGPGRALSLSMPSQNLECSSRCSMVRAIPRQSQLVYPSTGVPMKAMWTGEASAA